MVKGLNPVSPTKTKSRLSLIRQFEEHSQKRLYVHVEFSPPLNIFASLLESPKRKLRTEGRTGSNGTGLTWTGTQGEGVRCDRHTHFTG